MAFYLKRGAMPQKKHITFYKDDKKSLYYEELVSTLGFDGIFGTKYHIHAPTRVEEIKAVEGVSDAPWEEAPLSYYHFQTDKIEKKGDFISARSSIMYNSDVNISTATVRKNNRDLFYKNAYAHELIFIHNGSGTCKSEYGDLPIKEGDYLIIPKGIIYQLVFNQVDDVKLFIVESSTAYDIPRKYRNDYGQILEHAPYAERDFFAPTFVDPVDQLGEFPILTKAGARWFIYKTDHHPFDVAGWDGYHYPYTFNIKDFAPAVGKIHLPPPVHLVFITGSFVVCNFTPRLYDFHPQAIPAPYFHSNLDSDEVLYYVSGDFMSRKGISPGSITLHPMGLPHGPQPGKIEASVGKKEANEYAVMVDTFAPLKLTTQARNSHVQDYYRSWLPK